MADESSTTQRDPSASIVAMDASGITHAERVRSAKETYAKRVALRKKEIISLVVRQTAYTREVAKDKLEANGYLYIDVIKEYMDPGGAHEDARASPPDTRSVNQMVMGEIRDFMDTANRQYNARKERQEALENYKRKLLLRLIKAKQQQQQQQQQQQLEEEKPSEGDAEN